MSCKAFRIGAPKIEKLDDGCFIDWNNKRIIKGGLASGVHYASYYDRECTQFSFWLSRPHIKSIKSQARVENTAIAVNNTTN